MFSIINRAIDLGEEIVSYKKLGFPGRYREIFYLLEKNRIINEKSYNELSDLVYFRNLAAHEYHTFTENDVFNALKKISTVNNFIVIVKNVCNKKNNSKNKSNDRGRKCRKNSLN